MRAALFYGKYRYTIGDRSTATLILNYANSPQADDAGALLRSCKPTTARRTARDLNLRFQAGRAALASPRWGGVRPPIFGKK